MTAVTAVYDYHTQNELVTVTLCTGWPKKVSHYQ